VDEVSGGRDGKEVVKRAACLSNSIWKKLYTVERFTPKPSSTATDLSNPPPRLPPEIQYWAGVIMRNACRKDNSRGIQQCANIEFFGLGLGFFVGFFFWALSFFDTC
jgi:hypothetical protein